MANKTTPNESFCTHRVRKQRCCVIYFPVQGETYKRPALLRELTDVRWWEGCPEVSRTALGFGSPRSASGLRPGWSNIRTGRGTPLSGSCRTTVARSRLPATSAFLIRPVSAPADAN